MAVDTNPDYVTTREYDSYQRTINGQLNRIEKSVDEVKGMLRNNQEQFGELLGQEITRREKCAESHERQLSGMEKRVNDHETKFTVSKWVWRGVVALVGLAVAVTPIILAVTHVI